MPTLIIIAVFILVLYFFMLRPQKKQQREEAAMRDSLAVGDEVTTIGGIIGKVVSIKGETFVLETTKDKTKIRFLKGAIRSIDVKMADLAAQAIEGGAEAKDALPEKNEKKPQRAKKSSKNTEEAAPAAEVAAEAPVAEATEENK